MCRLTDSLLPENHPSPTETCVGSKVSSPFVDETQKKTLQIAIEPPVYQPLGGPLINLLSLSISKTPLGIPFNNFSAHRSPSPSQFVSATILPTSANPFASSATRSGA